MALTECTKQALWSSGVEGKGEQRGTGTCRQALWGLGISAAAAATRNEKQDFHVNSPTSSDVCSEAASQAGTQVCRLVLKYHHKAPKRRRLGPTVLPVFQRSEYLSELPFTTQPWVGQSCEQLMPIKGDDTGEGGCAREDTRPYQSFWGKGLVWKSFKE